MKASKLRRKQLDALRAIADVPWPARKYTLAPTFGEAAATKILVGTCSRKVAESEVTEGRFIKKKKTVDIPCQGNVYVKRGFSYTAGEEMIANIAANNDAMITAIGD